MNMPARRIRGGAALAGKPPVIRRRFAIVSAFSAVLLVAFCAGGASVAAGQDAPASAPAADERALQPLSEFHGVPAPPRQQEPPLEDSPEALALYEEAQAAFDEGRYRQTLAKLDEAINKAEGNHYELLYLMALTKQRVGRLGEARAAAELAAQLRHESADVHYLLGVLSVGQGQQQALDHFRSATLRAERELNNPRVTAAWWLLGQELERAGYLAAAAEAYAAFDLAIWDTNPEHRHASELTAVLRAYPHGALLKRLSLLARVGRADKAVAATQEMLQLRPDEPFVARAHVDALLAAGRADDAYAFCREHLEDPEFGRALQLGAVRSAAAAGKLESWLGELENGLEGDPSAAVLCGGLARALEYAGEFGPAARLRQALAQQAPDEGAAAWAWALDLRRAGDVSAGLEVLNGFYSAHPDDSELTTDVLADWLDFRADAAELTKIVSEHSADADKERAYVTKLSLGAAAVVAGQYDLAERLLKAAISERPEQTLAAVLWGHGLLRQYRWGEAQAVADELLRAHPDLGAAHYLAAAAQDGLDENEAAEEAYKQALRFAPEDTAAAVHLAQLCHRTGNLLGAQRYYEEALRADPNHAGAIEALIESYLGGGKPEIARQHYDRAEAANLPEDALRRMRTSVRFADAPFGEEHLAELERQFAEHPDDVETGLKLGAGLFVLRKYAAASRAAEQVALLAPDESRALSLLGSVRARQLEFDGAIEVWETLVQRYSNRVTPHVGLANSCLADFRLERAREVLRRLVALPLKEEDVENFRDQLLDSFTEFSDFDGALALLDEWHTGVLDERLYHNARLRVLLAAGRNAEAVKLAREQLDAATDPNAKLAWRELYIGVCKEAQEYGPAIAEARQWYGELPANRYVAAVLVDVLLAADQTDEALEFVNGITAQDYATAIEKRIWLAGCYAARDDTDRALAEYEALLDERTVAPDDKSRVRLQVLNVLESAKRYDEALKYCDAWLGELNAAETTLRSGLSAIKEELLQRAGRTAEYLELLEQRWKNDPENALLNNNLGYAWVDQGRNVPQALDMIRLAVSEEPLNAAYLDSLGWALYKTGAVAEGRKHLARAVRLRQGQDPVVFDHLGDAEFRLGDSDAAREQWERALELLAKADDNQLMLTQRTELMAALRAKLAALEGGRTPEVAPLAGEHE